MENSTDFAFNTQSLRPLAHGVKGALSALLAVSDLQARPYQERIVQSAIEMFAGIKQTHGRTMPAARSVLIESPTRSGKTVMGLATAALLQKTTGARVV